MTAFALKEPNNPFPENAGFVVKSFGENYFLSTPLETRKGSVT